MTRPCGGSGLHPRGHVLVYGVELHCWPCRRWHDEHPGATYPRPPGLPGHRVHLRVGEIARTTLKVRERRRLRDTPLTIVDARCECGTADCAARRVAEVAPHDV